MQEPPVRHRRSERRFSTESPVSSAPSPSSEGRTPPVRSALPTENISQEPAHIVRTSVSRTSVDVSRSPETLRNPSESAPLPMALIAVCIVFFLLTVSLFAASKIMQNYLTQREEARIAAHQKLLEDHPLGYEPLIRQYAGYYNLQSAYVAAIILNESNYNPRAVSSVGARGLMQLMPDTAEWIAGKLNDRNYSFENMFDPETNIRYGCWYLNYLAGLFSGDPVAVTSAYHAGQGTVRTWLADGVSSTDGGKTLDLNTMPDGPTRKYARRVTNAYAIYDALYDHILNPLPVSDPDTDSV